MQVEKKGPGIRELLLARRGVVFVETHGGPQPDELLRAVELELGDVGYVLSARLSARLARASLEELGAFRAWALDTLLEHAGGRQKHEPLFRNFPRGVPADTLELWWTKVLVHFLQAEGQPCLTCGKTGTTHVLRPCEHVVCDHCFDGSNYSACPVCEHHVDRESPFFRPAEERGPPLESVTFRRLDLRENPDEEARQLFLSLCERKQALSPSDRDALFAVVRGSKAAVLDWLPSTIPVRETVATIFGSLYQACGAELVLPQARRYMSTATDVLRFIAVVSGTDGSLLPETIVRQIEVVDVTAPFWGKISARLGIAPAGPGRRTVPKAVQVHRFKVARLPRALRRALFAILEELDGNALVEDMLRHQSYWVWVGEFLHPHEYAKRFPKVAHAFRVVREQGPAGEPAPDFQTWNARVEQTVRARDIQAALRLLRERPGEFVRRLDYLLRSSGSAAAREQVLALFAASIARFATPVLLTLKTHLPTRARPAAVRVYWPKGKVARGVSAPDERASLPPETIDAALRLIDDELLGRFARLTAFEGGVLDDSLREVMVPFNERTASRSAIDLPRGSRIAITPRKWVRLFLHWCEPEKMGRPTDLDLSVAFYDERWNYLGVCSYYQLETRARSGDLLARSAGDLRDGPWPEGASEFVDLDREAALRAGVRYAVMVVNAYAGMPFSQLQRAFAGLMLRDDPAGKHFDARTVELKFALAGENGIFLPLVLDVRDNELHWLDVHSKGQLEMNNVVTSNSTIAKICPEQMQYFSSGVRASMWDLGALHAAARCRQVWVRGCNGVVGFQRSPGESVGDFHRRLVEGAEDAGGAALAADGTPLLALLYRGDLDLPRGSSVYALFRERISPNLAASDLLS